MDGLDLVDGGGRGFDGAFGFGDVDAAGVGGDEGAFAVASGFAGGVEDHLEGDERVDAHAGLGVVEAVPPAVDVAWGDVDEAHAAEGGQDVVLRVLADPVSGALLQWGALGGATFGEPCGEVFDEGDGVADPVAPVLPFGLP